MPYSGKNLSEIRKDIVSEEEFRGIVNKLGNKTGYIDSVYPIDSALVADFKDVHKPYWKKNDINAATEKAAERIVEFIFNS